MRESEYLIPVDRRWEIPQSRWLPPAYLVNVFSRVCLPVCSFHWGMGFLDLFKLSHLGSLLPHPPPPRWKIKHKITLFHTVEPIEMFYSRHTFFLWPYMVLCRHLLTQDDTEHLECVIGYATSLYLVMCSNFVNLLANRRLVLDWKAFLSLIYSF